MCALHRMRILYTEVSMYRPKNAKKKALKPNVSVPASGDERVRTDGLLRAKQALSQLSYTPATKTSIYHGA